MRSSSQGFQTNFSDWMRRITCERAYSGIQYCTSTMRLEYLLRRRVNRFYTVLGCLGKDGKTYRRAKWAPAMAAPSGPLPRVGGWETLVIRQLHPVYTKHMRGASGAPLAKKWIGTKSINTPKIFFFHNLFGLAFINFRDIFRIIEAFDTHLWSTLPQNSGCREIGEMQHFLFMRIIWIQI